MRAERGFTLIELLIVLVIISVTASIAVLAFGDFGASRKIIMAAEQFSSYVKLIQQKAILESNTFGITIQKDGFETYYLEPGGKWQAMPSNTLFHWPYFPKNSLVVLQNKTTTTTHAPDIIINPAGEMTGFRLNFGNSAKADIISVIGKPNGALLLTNQKNYAESK
jgi:general secretion pathway protein H